MRMRLSAMLAFAVLSACGPTSPSVMEFVEITPAQPRIGEVVTVRFRLLDERGNPLAGTRVDFKLAADKAGVTLSPASATSIRGSGYAETQVVASGRVNSIIVVATAGDKQVFSPPITFAGTVPNGRQFTFQCGPIGGTATGGRHAIGAYDQTRYLIAGSRIECTAHVGDRNGDGVEGALVSFLAEAGTIGPSETSLSDVVGNATVLYKTSYPLPQEVNPEVFSWTPPNDLEHTGHYVAPLWMHPYEWVENPLTLATTAVQNRNYTLREPRRPDPIRFKPDGSGRYENNPRDNLVTLLAVTAGEEGFTDFNNNGVYDQGEPFDDLPEPFVDMNDDGTRNELEPFIDIDGDRQWDPKNDRWDANTLIWVQERILWTGVPASQDFKPPVPVVPGYKATVSAVEPLEIKLRCADYTTTPTTYLSPGQPCGQAGQDPGGGPAQVSAYMADPWFNALARNSDNDGCTLDVSADAPVKLYASTATGSAFTYPAGEYFGFSVGDSRDPNLPPLDQLPTRQVPIKFNVPMVCTYTSSPTDGYVVKVIVGLINGSIN